MPSMRPSQYAMQQRTDGGPFLRFDNGEAKGLSKEELEAIESGIRSNVAVAQNSEGPIAVRPSETG